MPGRMVLLVLAAVLATTPAYAFRNFNVSSSSMLPTLGAGDVVTAQFYGVDYDALAKGLSLDAAKSEAPAFQPKPGDLAVFKPSGMDEYIKRIVGVGGDRVQMKGGLLFLNGAAVETAPVEPVEGGCREGETCAFFRETLPGGATYVVVSTQEDSRGDDTEEFTVPPGFFFMLGDNRDNSLDSRFGPDDTSFGSVPRDALIGRVVTILYSPRPAPPFAERLAGFPSAR